MDGEGEEVRTQEHESGSRKSLGSPTKVRIRKVKVRGSEREREER